MESVSHLRNLGQEQRTILLYHMARGRENSNLVRLHSTTQAFGRQKTSL